MGREHARGQRSVILAQFSEHIERLDVDGIVVFQALEAGNLADRADGRPADFAHALRDVVRHREKFAAAILADDLVRVHTVDRDENPLYWTLLHAAGKATGLPVLYNTSFNLFGEPLVCTPRDAVRSFYSSGIDAMFVGHFLLQK